MKGLYFSDIHFGRKNNSPQHNQDCIDYLEWMIKRAKEYDVGYLAFLGDWFEHRNAINIETMLFSYRGMSILEQSGLPVYMVVGNHDLYQRHTRDIHSVIYGNKFSNITIIDKPTRIEFKNGDKIMLSPFLFEHEYSQLSEFIDCPIWGGHFEFSGFILTGAYTKSEHGMDPSTFTKPLILSGHFHKRQSQKNIVYIGNTFPMDFADANDNDRGCAICDHEETSLEFENWTDGPTYIKTTASAIKEGKVRVPPKCRVICKADISLTYEEQLELKQIVTEGQGARGIELQDPDIAAQINEGTDVEEDENAPTKTAEEMIIELLSTVEADDIDASILVKWFKNV